MAKGKKNATIKIINDHGPMGFAMFAAWLGALVYFIGRVDGFWNIILAFLKACIWPAYVVYHALQSLGA